MESKPKGKIAALLEEMPLPGGSVLSEVVEDRLGLQGLNLFMMGLSAQVPGFGEVSASAIGPDPEAVTVRSFFELHERIAVVLAEKSAQAEPGRRWPLTDLGGNSRGTISGGELFPQAPLGATWCYSKSNGVAAHSDPAKGRLAAARELIERDRILRSWFGEFTPKRILNARFGELAAFSESYDLKALDFGNGVAGVLGFPLKRGLHLIMGFGSSDRISAALEHAIGEALQRLAFLWDTPVPENLPEIVPHVDFHLDTYLLPQKLLRLTDWLDGRKTGIAALPIAEEKDAPVLVAEITSAELQGKLRVFKAICPKRVPLTFGVGNPAVAMRIASDDFDFWVHPIA